MELAIIAGVALLGYNLSGGGTPARPAVDEERRKPLPAPNAYPSLPGGGAQRQMDRFNGQVQRRWNQALDPSLTGIVTPNTARDPKGMLPFFRSMKSQNTNDSIKQRRVEMYTGAVMADDSATGTYRHKREVPQGHPTNPQLVTSAGTQGNPAEVRQLERYVLPQLHNNVSPLPQTRVGPGLGMTPDAPATDGFHPMLRVLPPNVNAHRKNNLLARTNHGASAVATGTQRTVAAKNRPDAPMVELCDRPPEASRAATTAPAFRMAGDDRPGTGRVAGHLYFGGSGATTAAVPVNKSADSRNRSDVHGGKPMINLTGAANGVGSFVAGHFDPARFANQTRENYGGFGFFQGQDKARTAPAAQILPPTHRDLSRRDLMLHGTIKGPVDVGQMRRRDAPRATLREGTCGCPEMTNLKGQAATGMDNAVRDTPPNREAKRGDQVAGRINAPGRGNVFEHSNAGAAAMRSDRNLQCNQGGLPTVGPAGRKYGKTGALTTPYNKLPPSNPWSQQLDLAQTQLATNQLALPPLGSA